MTERDWLDMIEGDPAPIPDVPPVTPATPAESSLPPAPHVSFNTEASTSHPGHESLTVLA